MRKDILPFYTALGLSPGAEPIEIRRAYRQMIQQWHPDLFKPGSPMQTTAEDITKEINEAYDQLYRKKLYRNFLPKSERKEEPQAHTEPANPVRRERPAKAPQRRRGKEPKVRSALDWSKVKARWSVIRKSRWARVPAALGLAALVALTGRKSLQNFNSARAARPAENTALAPSPAASQPRTETMRLEPVPMPAVMAPGLIAGHIGYVAPAAGETTTGAEGDHTLLMDRAGALLDVIELGDSKARVRAIQGKPDEVSDTIFRYGSSVVYFKEGRVTAWRDRLPRLRVRDWSLNLLPTLDRFSLGSSRADVVRAQGQPGSFDAQSYTYGSSVVMFEGGSVSGWREGDVRLQRFEMPSLPFFDLDRMALWDARGPLEF